MYFSIGDTIMVEQEQNYLTPEILRQIGKEGEETIWPEPLDRSSLRRFIQATRDDNPLYYDEEYAKSTKYGSVIAPPFYFHRSFPSPLGVVEDAEKEEMRHRGLVDTPGFAKQVNAGSEIEWFGQVRIGDTLNSKTVVSNIEQKQGKNGPMILITYDRIIKNQDDKLIAITTQKSLRRQSEGTSLF
jgi:acyl dehydratase